MQPQQLKLRSCQSGGVVVAQARRHSSVVAAASGACRSSFVSPSPPNNLSAGLCRGQLDKQQQECSAVSSSCRYTAPHPHAAMAFRPMPIRQRSARHRHNNLLLPPPQAAASAAAAAGAADPGLFLQQSIQLPQLVPASGPWGVWTGLIVAGAFGMWSERTRVGKELSGALVATLAGSTSVVYCSSSSRRRANINELDGGVRQCVDTKGTAGQRRMAASYM